jgi:hypothetical protein
MAEVLAIPFRIRAGRVERMVVDSDAEQLALIKALAETRVEERALVPSFGLDDQTFAGGFDLQALAAAMSVYGPDRELLEATIEEASDARVAVRVEVL